MEVCEKDQCICAIRYYEGGEIGNELLNVVEFKVIQSLYGEEDLERFNFCPNCGNKNF